MDGSTERKQLSQDDWWRRVNADCRACSGQYWPIGPAEVTEYRCLAGAFLKGQTYLVRFTNRDGSRIVDWNAPEATPIRIEDFAKNPAFVSELLSEWDNGTPITSAKLLVHHCLGCGRSVVIDGVHRIVSIATRSAYESELHITELAGSAWPSHMPDMRPVCNCDNQN